MKREGRQHGMVRTYPIVPSPWDPTPHHRNALNSPPTAGLFTKVSHKPTNHSKFTGKCGRVRCSDCHVHPAGKTKAKAKGTLKRRTADAVTDNRLITWRVADARPGLKFSGLSATGILDHLAGVDYTDGAETEDHSQSGLILDHHDDDGGDAMSFCDVGFAMEHVDEDEDGWCLL